MQPIVRSKIVGIVIKSRVEIIGVGGDYRGGWGLQGRVGTTGKGGDYRGSTLSAVIVLRRII